MTLKVDLLRLRKTMEDMKLPYCVINRCIKYFSPHIVQLQTYMAKLKKKMFALKNHESEYYYLVHKYLKFEFWVSMRAFFYNFVSRAIIQLKKKLLCFEVWCHLTWHARRQQQSRPLAVEKIFKVKYTFSINVNSCLRRPFAVIVKCRNVSIIQLSFGP